MALWGRVRTTRAAIWLTALVALLSVTTGLVNLSTRSVARAGDVIPTWIEQTAGFTGAMTGFAMLASAMALRRGYRTGWLATLAMLPLTAIQGVLQQSVLSAPLVALSVLSVPTVWLTRDRFVRPADLSVVQQAAIVAFVGTVSYGTLGTYALREEFPAVETLTDALYFTVVTASTVGYGDVTPATPIGKLYTLSVLALGVASFGLLAGSLLGPAIEARFANVLGTMTASQLTTLEDHVLVLGYGDLTAPILDELTASAPYVVVAPTEPASVPDDAKVLRGDPSDERLLDDAGIDRARAVVVATEDDAEDALAILTARELAPEIRIVAAATNRRNVAKLEHAGADAVISPALIGGRLIVESALGNADSTASLDPDLN
ncbi:NAD-binding protein [Halococcoides cellulosivorans]|uniref:Potassium channel protein n=1 Tax=Halococcoides cellulosivorans TaxID=1679096 RepID=A0A2R4X2K6_9EURY|nr:NAD-binding protein [Halococcoides cellulosivorans]AWB28028.1 potassium channel protein [Halococcoides cellulosivorans]